MQYGGGHGGFIATDDDPQSSWSTRPACSASRPRACPASTGSATSPTSGPRSPCARRARSGSAPPPRLWGITAGVYLALMGPQGMRELGETRDGAHPVRDGPPGRASRRSRPVRGDAPRQGVRASISARRAERSPRSRARSSDAASSAARTSRAEFPGSGRARSTASPRSTRRTTSTASPTACGGAGDEHDERGPGGQRRPPGREPSRSPRRFHQARWDEPIIFELSEPGARGVLLPRRRARDHRRWSATRPPRFRRACAGRRRRPCPSWPSSTCCATTRGCPRRTWASTSTSTSARAPAR